MRNTFPHSCNQAIEQEKCTASKICAQALSHKQGRKRKWRKYARSFQIGKTGWIWSFSAKAEDTRYAPRSTTAACVYRLFTKTKQKRANNDKGFSFRLMKRYPQEQFAFRAFMREKGRERRNASEGCGGEKEKLLCSTAARAASDNGGEYRIHPVSAQP